ncbi:kelch-like protein 11 [Branchiostoma floridae x Branchiostoma belcheri]
MATGGNTETVRRSFDHSFHANTVLCALNEQRIQEKFCDVVLEVEGRHIPAHRNVLAACSPYFDAMFGGNLAESRSSQVTLTEVSPEAVSKVIEYMYKGQVQVDPKHAEELLHASDLFLITELKLECQDVLQDMLDSNDAVQCLRIRNLAKIYNMTTLEEKAMTFVRQNFSEIAKREDILQTSIEDMQTLLSDEHLQVENEESVLELILRWIQFDKTNREQYLTELVKLVRYGDVNKDFLSKVRMEDLVRESEECQLLIDDVMSKFRTELEAMPGMKTRGGRLKEVLMMAGGYLTSAAVRFPIQYSQAYVIEEGKWMGLPRLPSAQGAYGIATCHRQAYSVGGLFARPVGSRTTAIVSSVKAYRYDSLSNTWTQVADMNAPRAYPGVAACGGYVYAIGGLSSGGLHRNNTVERYSPKEDQWQHVASMNSARFSVATVVKDDRYIYCISGKETAVTTSQSVEVYDTETNRWRCLPRAPITFEEVPFAEVHPGDGMIHVYSIGQSECVFDPKSELWTVVSDGPIPHLPDSSVRRKSAVHVEKGVIHVWGGHDRNNSNTIYSSGFVYRDETWTAMNAGGIATMSAAFCKLKLPVEFLRGLHGKQ